MDDVNAFKTLEPLFDHSIRVVGSGIEIFGVLIIVAGIAWSTYRQLRRRISEQDSDVYKIRIGRSLLLGLEVLVAADIVKTIAHELTFMSLGLLAGLVLVRTFLSWTLVLEIEGRWPWQREPSPMSSRSRAVGDVDRTEKITTFGSSAVAMPAWEYRSRRAPPLSIVMVEWAGSRDPRPNHAAAHPKKVLVAAGHALRNRVDAHCISVPPLGQGRSDRTAHMDGLVLG